MHITQNNTPSFRKDINGLRAIAVIAVIFYHFSVSGFGGGFVGVDIFFVISGFLMTRIITERLAAKTFSLTGFYLARAKRIVPALIALCVILLLAGWFFLPPAELKELGSQAKSSLLFTSNLRFMSEAGYFDSASHEKWLLHTWSLSVEWQYYLLFPLFLMAVTVLTRKKRHVATAIGLLALCSFSFSLIQAEHDAAKNFYSLATRTWEMAMGGLACLIPALTLSRKAKAVAVHLALGLMAASTVLLSASAHWPGPLTLVPVLGCALVIWLNGRTPITDNPVSQWLGKISYSLYLWHWPIAVSLVYLQIDSALGTCIGLLLTLLCGYASYALFEALPQKTLSSLTPPKAATVLAVVLVGVLGTAQAYRKVDFTDRTSPVVVVAENEAKNKNPRRSTCMLSKGVNFPSCNFGGEGELSAIVLGDSHANAVVSAVAAALPNKDLRIQEWSYASCPTLLGMHLVINDRQCKEFNEWAVQQLDALPAAVPVIIVNRSSSYPMGDEGGPNHPKDSPYIYFSKPYRTPTKAFLDEYQQDYTRTICKLASKRKVFLVRPFPEMPLNVPKQLARNLMLDKQSDITIPRSAYDQRHAFVYQSQDRAAEACGATVLDPTPYLCDASNCYGSVQGRPLYYDASHLSEFGNQRLIPMFEAVFRTTRPLATEPGPQPAPPAS